MEPQKDVAQQGASEYSIMQRYYESRVVEREILFVVQRAFFDLTKCTNPQELKGSFAENQLLSNIQRFYQDWQSFPDSHRSGLNSGNVGEAICRLVALGIMEDMPEILSNPVYENTLEVVHSPSSNEDKGIIKLTITAGYNENCEEIGVAVKFNTSLVEIEKRQKQLTDEIDKARQKIREIEAVETKTH